MRNHRDVKPIPMDPVIRRTRIQWLLEHRVWTHPTMVRMPKDGNLDEMLVPIEGKNLSSLKLDDPTWVDHWFDNGSLQDCVHFDFVYVNPKREYIEDDPGLNTAFRVWVEAGPRYDMSTDKHMPVPAGGWNDSNRWGFSHDIRLDCGAPTMDGALLKLAALVECFYNEDGTNKDHLWWCPEKTCSKDAHGYCTACGFAVEDEDE